MDKYTYSLAKAKVLVIEDDESVNRLITTWFQEERVKTAHGLMTGESAWQELHRVKYDVIILDWRLGGKLGGLGLFNRIRCDKYYKSIPVMIISGFLDKKDFTILDEFPNTRKVEKPLQKAIFLNEFNLLMQEKSWQNAQAIKAKSILDEMSKEHPNISDHVRAIREQSPNPLPMLLNLGVMLKEVGQNGMAITIFQEAIKVNERSASAHNHLGKIYLEIGDIAKAKECLLKAKSLSPNNLDRLCDLGNVALHELDIPLANSYFHKAKAIDHEDAKAVTGLDLVNNVSEWIAEARSIPSSFASLLNAIGVSLVRSQDFKNGLNHYQSALKHVYDDKVKAKLAFNLGLGHMRWRNFVEALAWFKQSTKYDPDYSKPGTYIQKLSKFEVQLPKEDLTSQVKKSREEDFEDAIFSSFEGSLQDPQSLDPRAAIDTLGFDDDIDAEFETESINEDVFSLYSPMELDSKKEDDAFIEPQKDAHSLVTFIERNSIPFSCLKVEPKFLKVICYRSVGVNTKMIYNTGKVGYELVIKRKLETQENGNVAYILELEPADNDLDLCDLIDDGKSYLPD
ncbi:MAG: tetratricopeptide repeat protein [Oligoflexales bacterium]|nr:tetratricopeptide repeat protein [Oligoflexales bacterium]